MVNLDKKTVIYVKYNFRTLMSLHLVTPFFFKFQNLVAFYCRILFFVIGKVCIVNFDEKRLLYVKYKFV